MRKYVFHSMVLIVITSCGCSVEPETLDSLRAAVETISCDESSSMSGAHNLSIESEGAEASFQPPHPDRVDAFAFAAGIDGSSEEDTGASVTNVVVIGFANVREHRVFLTIDDQTRSLRVGEVFRGIEVVSIREPVVELRMGSLLWTATMFDKTPSLR